MKTTALSKGGVGALPKIVERTCDKKNLESNISMEIKFAKKKYI